MVTSPRQRLILPLAPTGAGMVGVFTALLFVALPSGTLDTLVVDSGVASLINAAQPPLGFTARALLVLVGGGIATAIAWVALFVAVGTRSVIVNGPRTTRDAGPAVRRGDVHPDAPPRQPLLANRDLGTPFLDVRADPTPAPIETPTERALPTDLDMPLAAFDPQSFVQPFAPPPTTRAEPADAPLPIRLDSGRAFDLIAASMQHAPPPRIVATDDHADRTPIRLDPGHARDLIAASLQSAPEPPTSEDHAIAPRDAAVPIRIETGRAIDLIAASMQQPSTPSAPAESSDSIRALVDRLERRVAKRDVAPASTSSREARQDSIRDTLDTLRGLATRTG